MMNDFLNVDLSFNYQDLKVFIPVVGALIGFMIFWFAWKSDKLKQKLIDKYGEDRGLANLVIYTKILGGFSMGVLPAVAYLIAFPETTLSQLGLGLHQETLLTTALWMLGLGALMVFLMANNAKKPKNLVHYPQIRAKVWDSKMFRGNLAGWATYLFGYEFLFRGVLLFPLVEAIGLWPAIAVNIGMYSATHIPKGLNEAIGAIPLSIVLCLLSVYTGSIWIAVVVHIAMAWTNTTVALKHHPEMQYIKN